MTTQPQKPVPPSVKLPTTGVTPASPPTERVPNETGSASDAGKNAHKPEAADIAKAIRSAFRENVEPAKGVVLVTSTDPTIVAPAVAAIANGVHTEGTIADLPVARRSTITFLHPSGSREVESVKSYARKDIQAGKVRTGMIDHCRRLNVLSPEGVHFLMNRIEPESCVFVTVEYRQLKLDDAIAALTEINAEATRLGVLVVICVLHAQKQDMASLRDHCAVSIVVRKCEPGPGAQIAIVLDNLSLAGEHERGIGRVMVEAFFEPDGTWKFAREPFIAERAIIRLGWYILRLAHRLKEDVPLAKIAKVVGIVPSNISRGLTPLLISPKNAVGVGPSKGWFDRWAADYNLDLVWPRKKPDQGADAGVVGGAAKASDSPNADGAGHVSKDAPVPGRTHPASPNGGKP